MKRISVSIGAVALLAGGLFAADQPVVVDNTPSKPVPVVGGAGLVPYQFSGITNFGLADPGVPGSQALPASSAFTVTIPAGKKLIIESVTVSCPVTGDDICRAMLRVNNGATEHILAMTPQRVASENGPTFVAYQGTFPLRAYVSSGNVYEILFRRGRYSVAAPGEGVEFSVAGYLADEVK